MSSLTKCDVCKELDEKCCPDAQAARAVVVKGVMVELTTTAKGVDPVDGCFDICGECMALAIAAEQESER